MGVCERRAARPDAIGLMGPSAAPPAPRGPRDDEFDRLAPLFGERTRLPADHPRRQILHDQLITGYLPLAQRVARKHAYQGITSTTSSRSPPSA
jgi:hypothetical protein